MSRTIRITMDVHLSELSDETKKRLADEEQADDASPAHMTLASVDPRRMARLVEDLLTGMNDELWAGSEMYAQITDVDLQSAEDVTEQGEQNDEHEG